MTTPLIDVVMLISHQPLWADLAIRAVEHHTKNPYRLILVDQATTTPEAKAVLASAKERGHIVFRAPENRSFSNGNNLGAGLGDAKFLVFLNDDALVTENWDGALIQDCSEKGVGLVGARSNFAGGVQADMRFKGEPPYLVFVCVALRREVWNAVGPMDEENFTGFSCEDLDYSWRVQKAGYKLKVSDACYVLHAGSRSIAKQFAADAIAAKNGAGLITALRGQNEKYGHVLEAKWGRDFVVEHSKLQQRGLVTTYHAERWTRVEFLKNLMGLRRSDNVGFEYLQVSRLPIHMARQAAADFAVDSGMDWWVQIDDDATFPPDVLRRLLAPQKDVVCALAYQRKPPHLTCAFETGPDGLLGTPLDNIEHTGVRKVDISGFHCSIMRTSVIKKMRDAGIKQYFGGFDSKVGEDFACCINMKKVGVQVHVDTDLISGHIGEEIVVDESYKLEWRQRQLVAQPPQLPR